MAGQTRWTYERGGLWTLDLTQPLPPPVAPRREAVFSEARAVDAPQLALVMGWPVPGPLQRRLASGRRCFVAYVQSSLAAYGWVSYGQERVGELERRFHMLEGEAYIWECVTLPEYRGQRLFSALLSHMQAALRAEGRVPRIWIGSGLANRPSVQGIVNAGFQPVLWLVYLRLFGVHAIWVVPFSGASPPVVQEGRKLVLTGRERAFGPLVIGLA
ncbi:MAG: GNAT family N-acetyltransferase [Chloroflexia bacterium]